MVAGPLICYGRLMYLYTLLCYMTPRLENVSSRYG
jgi:hypothetical protein